MEGLDLGSKNMLFIFRYLCLFTFRQHKQLPIVARFFKGYASLEVMQQREVTADPTFLTGLYLHTHGVLTPPEIKHFNKFFLRERYLV
jgi:hypothetical protein